MSFDIIDKDFLKNYDGPAIRVMEVCGTHTSAIFKSGIRSFLSPKIRLVSGPGCPVCVTVPDYIDRCVEISMTPGCELVCFGDLLKIPGARGTLSDAKGAGARVRMAWSPFDAVALAQNDPDSTYIVAAIGFETTAPAFGLLLEEAEARGVRNLRLMTSLKSALAAIDWICAAGEDVDAFLCPGHVSVVTGADVYIPLAEKYKKPFVVAGFGGGHLLAAVRAAAEDAAEGRSVTRNLYPEAVTAQGNRKARAAIERYFETGDAVWRGLGPVPGSGYFLREEYSSYDAGQDEAGPAAGDSANIMNDRERAMAYGDNADGCRCGDVILGRIDPDACPLFGTLCTPARAAGPCMVSSEGACGIWYRGRPGQ